jgi:hypothetical protein
MGSNGLSEKTRSPYTDAPFELADVLATELEHIRQGKKIPEDKRSLEEVFEALKAEELTALCFSGGGIRSATFGLGVVEALALYGLLDKFDYLSTVSGGGYLGSWLSAWIRREQVAKFENEKPAENGPTVDEANETLYEKYQKFHDEGVREVQRKLNVDKAAGKRNPNIEPKQLQHVREYSNYMTPRVGLLSADTWTFSGIYLRNLFLNWTIFIPLIAALLVVPRILVAIVNLQSFEKIHVVVASIVLIISGAMTLFVVIVSLPSVNREVSKPQWSTDGGVVMLAILPLMIMAFIATTLLAWFRVKPAAFDFFPFNDEFYRVVFAIGLPAITYLLIKCSVIAFRFFKDRRAAALSGKPLEPLKSFTIRYNLLIALSALLASIVGGLLMVLVAGIFLSRELFTTGLADNPQGFGLAVYACFAVPVFMLVFLVAATVLVGVASKIETDGDREWFARFGAWITIACVVWIFLGSITLFGPIAIEKLIAGGGSLFSYPWVEEASRVVVPAVGVISGVITLFGGFSGKSQVRNVPTKSSLSRFLAVAPQFAAVIFMAFILVGIAYLTTLLLPYTGDWLPTENHDPTKSFHIFVLNNSPWTLLFLGLVALLLIGTVMACLVNVNTFSLHGAYRDRLVRAYLGASKLRRNADPFTGFDDADNFQLHRLKGQRPFHVINATLNLVDGVNLAWQNRKAASFTMSPLYCGSWVLGYRKTYQYSRNETLGECHARRYCNIEDGPCNEACKLPGKSLRLGTAMAISGAAANPNMGYYSSPVVMFLMAMFNIRLGWWLGNTGKRGNHTDWKGKEYFKKPSPTIAVLPLISETLGRTDEYKRFVNVSDGGHFENLGLYEMIMRRCKLIVLSDAGADQKFAFDDLANAIEKCKVDLGVDIEFEDGIRIPPRANKRKKNRAETRYAVAKIKYPKNSETEEDSNGLLLYLKPTILGNEPVELRHYADTHATFPHESTADQLFDEKQFEAYRELGFFTMNGLLEKLNPRPESLTLMFDAIQRQRVQFVKPETNGFDVRQKRRRPRMTA